MTAAVRGAVGLWRASDWRHTRTRCAGCSLRLVQPNIPQAEKYVRALMPRNWQRLMDSQSSRRRRIRSPTHIVWPEAATGFPAGPLSRRRWIRSRMLTARGQSLITGSDRIAAPATDASPPTTAFICSGQAARCRSVYDKFHLVPFGEYLPFAGLLNRIGITKLTVGVGLRRRRSSACACDAGVAPPVTPLICYEVIFPARCDRSQRAAARLVRQYHRRFLVRALGRAAPASADRAGARHRRRLADRARRQYRHQRDDRSLGTGARAAWRLTKWAWWMRLARKRLRRTLYARFGDLYFPDIFGYRDR